MRDSNPNMDPESSRKTHQADENQEDCATHEEHDITHKKRVWSSLVLSCWFASLEVSDNGVSISVSFKTKYVTKASS